jgi:hypothetical protein
MKSRRDLVEAEGCKRVTRTVGCDAVRRRKRKKRLKRKKREKQRSRRRRRRDLPKPCRKGSCNKIYLPKKRKESL